ncbi:MAG: FAD:protein FMN transferase [Actinomycetota bacterium]|nr:FAD:protein FMN transferase [Actinomycetota bacterium]
MPSHTFEAIGTRWTITTDVPLSASTAAALESRAEQFDASYSRFRTDSLVGRVAEGAGSYQFPSDAEPLFSLYRKLYQVTDGAVSPLVGRALEHLGYDAGYSLHRRSGPVTVPAWDDVLAVDGSVLTTTAPVLLDVGAAGKGYLVDLLAEILQADGIGDYLIDGSGDLAQHGEKVCRVGLEHPLDPTMVIGVANLQNAALCASATNRRRWGENLHHIIDPATADPTVGVLASWVVADTAALADGLATALFLAEPATLADHFTFSYVRVLASGAVEHSTSFPGELFR